MLQLADDIDGVGSSVDLTGTTGIQTVLGGAYEDTLIAGTSGVTLQGWNGSPSANASSDTFQGGSGADLFVLGDAVGNAYGHGDTAVARIYGFDATKDKIQLHDFGTIHAGSAGYQTRSGAPGEVDIFTYAGTGEAQHVASVQISRGTFDWTKDISLI